MNGGVGVGLCVVGGGGEGGDKIWVGIFVQLASVLCSFWVTTAHFMLKHKLSALTRDTHLQN